MPVLSLACHLPHNAPHIPWRYNYEQTTKQTKAINNSYIYIYINISCKCDTNRAGHLTLDAYASRPVACSYMWSRSRASEVQSVVYIYNLTFIISSKAYQLVYKNWQTPPYIGTTLLLVQSYKTPPYKNTSVQSPWKIGHERVVQASNVVLWPSKVHGANMEPTWVLSARDGPHVGPMNLAVRG